MIRIAEFDALAGATGTLYRPRVYAQARDDQWDAYIVFFPIIAGTVISTPRETTQPTLESLQHWASVLDSVYLEGALARAAAATPGIVMPATAAELDLAAAETLAAGDAVALHNAAERATVEAASELAAAEMHEQAAAAARDNAARLEQKRDELEDLAKETRRLAAETVATSHEIAASEARAVAADVERAKRDRKPARKRSSSRKKSG